MKSTSPRPKKPKAIKLRPLKLFPNYKPKLSSSQQKGKLSVAISESKRDDSWLISRLDYFWKNHFDDVSQDNPVVIQFGRYSKFRLGSIRLDRTSKISYITITGMFKNQNIPSDVVDHTIAHEMCHYTHGFSSFKPRLHKYPHHGAVVDKELRQRGLDYLLKAYRRWLKDYKKTLR